MRRELLNDELLDKVTGGRAEETEADEALFEKKARKKADRDVIKTCTSTVTPADV